MTHSNVQRMGHVPFPAFLGERVYMHEFTKAQGLPRHLWRWQPTVDAMLAGIDAPRSIFLMIDQSPVQAGQAQRRPGVHVDGVWNPAIYAHGHGGGRHAHSGEVVETLVLASDVLGCAAYVGDFEDEIGDDGDCSHIDVSGMERVLLKPGFAWAGPTLAMLHESVPVRDTCRRTLVRLNVQGA